MAKRNLLLLLLLLPLVLLLGKIGEDCVVPRCGSHGESGERCCCCCRCCCCVGEEGARIGEEERGEGIAGRLWWNEKVGVGVVGVGGVGGIIANMMGDGRDCGRTNWCPGKCGWRKAKDSIVKAMLWLETLHRTIAGGHGDAGLWGGRDEPGRAALMVGRSHRAVVV